MPKKVQYLGFESGVTCIKGGGWRNVNALEKADKPCKEQGFLRENYPQITELPEYYDNRCRPWYKLQKENPDHLTITDIYLFTDGIFALTVCAPFTKDGEFHGALCFDVIPKSEDAEFGNKWFKSSEALNSVEKQYAIFTDEPEFRSFDFDNSDILNVS